MDSSVWGRVVAKNGSKQAVREVWKFLEIEGSKPSILFADLHALLIQEMQ